MLLINHANSQNKTLTLEFQQSKKNPIEFSCLPVSKCIDTVFQQEDTLFICMQDSRTFYKDSASDAEFCKWTISSFKKRRYKEVIEVENDYEFNFIVLRTLDFAYILKLEKNSYKLIKINEFKADRQYKDFKEGGIIFRY
jgi:hypothetical protein